MLDDGLQNPQGDATSIPPMSDRDELDYLLRGAESLTSAIHARPTPAGDSPPIPSRQELQEELGDLISSIASPEPSDSEIVDSSPEGFLDFGTIAPTDDVTPLQDAIREQSAAEREIEIAMSDLPTTSTGPPVDDSEPGAHHIFWPRTTAEGFSTRATDDFVDQHEVAQILRVLDETRAVDTQPTNETSIEDEPQQITNDDIDTLIRAQLGDTSVPSEEAQRRHAEALLKQSVAHDDFVTQQEIEAKMAAGLDPSDVEPHSNLDSRDQVTPSSHPEFDAAPTPATEVHSGTLSQDDIEALLQGASASAEPEAAPPAPDVDSHSGMLSQNDIESLIQGASASAEPATASPAPVAKIETGMLSQDDIEALLLGASEPTAPSISPPDDHGLLSQDDIELLMQGATPIAEAPAIPSTVSDSSENLPFSAHTIEEDTISQRELDTLLANHAAAKASAVSTPSIAAHSPGAPVDAPVDAPQALGITQDELDQLIEQALKQPPKPPTIIVDYEADYLTQEQLDTAIARFAAKSAAPVSAPEETIAWSTYDSDTVTQAEIESVIANRKAREKKPVEPVAAAPPAESQLLGQDDVEALLRGATPSDAAPAESSGGSLTLDQSEVEALLRGLSTEPVTPAPAAEANASTMLSQDEIERLLNNSTSDAGEPMLAPELEEVVAAGPLEQPIGNAASEDQIIGAQTGELGKLADDALVISPPESQPVPQPKPVAIPVAAQPAPIDTKPVNSEQVSGENLQAAAMPDDILSKDILDSIINQAKVSEPEPAISAAETETPPVEGESAADESGLEDVLQRPRIAVRTESAWKLVASIMAGVLSALGAFSYLVAHRVESVSYTAPTTLSPTQLSKAQKVMVRAQQSLFAGESAAALQDLNTAVSTLSPGNARNTADFTRIEQEMLALPDKPTEDETEAIHADIELLLDRAKTHPRAPEALLWNARLYEIEQLPFAALGMYERLLDDYPTASARAEAMFKAAEISMGISRPEQALGYYERLLQDFPASSLADRAKLGMGDANRALGNFTEARRLYTGLAQGRYGEVTGSEAFERLGDMEMERGNIPEAIKFYEQRLQTAPEFEGRDKVYLLLANAYRKKAEYGQARAVLQDLIDFFPSSKLLPQAYVQLSQSLDELGKRDDAIRVAQQAVQNFPKDAPGHENLGDLQVATNQFEPAAWSYLKAADVGANSPGVLLKAAEQFKRIDRAKDALDVYDRLLNSFPDAPEATAATIESAELLKDAFGASRDALTRLEHAAATTGDRTRRLPVLVALASMYSDLGLDDRAAALFDEITKISSEPDTQARAATALLRAGRLDEGLALASKVDLTKLPGERAYALLLEEGRALLKTDSEAARVKLEKAHNDYPNVRTNEGEQILLDTYLKDGLSQKARALVMDLKALAMRNPAAIDVYAATAKRLGDFFFQRGDYTAAEDTYTLLIEQAGIPEGIVSWSKFQRANSLLETGRYAEAIILYDEMAATKSDWAADAKSKAAYARILQERKGEPVTPARAQG